jgi:endo-1,4-beta-xylanase
MKKVENMKKLMTLILLAVPLASTVRAQWIVYDPTVHMQQILDEAQDIAKHVQMIENQVQQISERRRANVQKEESGPFRPALTGCLTMRQGAAHHAGTMKKIIAEAACLSLFCLRLLAADGGAKPTLNYNIPLWEPGKVPMAKGTTPLDAPFLTVFLPPENKRNRGSVIIAPGGSNIMLMYGCEGVEIAERYNDWGVAAFILTYRLSPHYGDDARTADGKRAIQLVRSRAAEWNLNPDRIGFAGFSAGSSMARFVVAASGAGNPAAPDPIDRVSSRPDYAVLVYGPGRSTTTEQLKDFPPTFLLSAAWDRGAANGSAQLFLDLNKAGAVVELHIYQKGRHGFGSAFTSPEFGPWMSELEHFLRQGGFLSGGKQ